MYSMEPHKCNVPDEVTRPGGSHQGRALFLCSVWVAARSEYDMPLLEGRKNNMKKFTFGFTFGVNYGAEMEPSGKFAMTRKPRELTKGERASQQGKRQEPRIITLQPGKEPDWFTTNVRRYLVVLGLAVLTVVVALALAYLIRLADLPETMNIVKLIGTLYETLSLKAK